MRRKLISLMALGVCHVATAGRVSGATPPSPVEGKAIDFLMANQGADGSWLAAPGPGPTALVLKGLLEAGHSPSEPAVQKALAYLASTRQPDGGYYTNANATYNTAIVLSALAKLPEAERAKMAADITGTQAFLKSIQSGAALALKDDKGAVVDANHPWYGGWGYGQGSKMGPGRRPDLSNSQFVIEALRDSGVPASDPSIQNALVFLTRVQASEGNSQPWAKGRDEGGFIYSMGWNAAHNFYGQSEGPDGKDRSGGDILTTYGSMTYAGLKSLLYADLSHDDPRVKGAVKWISANFTFESNPGLNSTEGLYYYYNAMSGALRAYGEGTITDAKGVGHDWKRELLTALAHKQKADGSFVNDQKRFMESDPVLCTAFAVLAMENTRTP